LFAKSALYNGYNPNPITIYKPLWQNLKGNKYVCVWLLW
jgi:hypothetical protein